MRDARRFQPAHVIVLGNEKGGSGKSTTAMHVVVALLKSGARVASIDTDGRQRSLTRYVENRAAWARKTGLPLEVPIHFTVPPADGELISEIQDREFRAFAEAVSRTEYGFDYVVIDTPGHNTYLMRVSHAMADTLITPINDSYVDFDVLGRVDPDTLEVLGPSHYAQLVAESLRQRRLVDDRETDWVVVRNRQTALASRNRRNIERGLKQLSEMAGFRLAEGISERVIFRELFPSGLTALDAFSADAGASEPTLSHISARNEVRNLLDTLNLPALRARPPAAPSGPTTQSGGRSPPDGDGRLRGAL
jgi:chromosome partitioning protein